MDAHGGDLSGWRYAGRTDHAWRECRWVGLVLLQGHDPFESKVDGSVRENFLEEEAGR